MDENTISADNPEIPEELQEILSLFNKLSGNLGTSARLDATEQKLGVVGQLGHDPEALEDEGRSFMLEELFDGQIESEIIEPYDITTLTREVDDKGFRYEFDVSAYLDERPVVYTIPFDDEL